MWIVILSIAVYAVYLYLSGKTYQSLLFNVMLATGGFQLIPMDWFQSPLVLSKPYDYSFFITAFPVFLNAEKAIGLCAKQNILKWGGCYTLFLVSDFLVSIVLFKYDPIQVLQSVRIFLWPLYIFYFFVIPVADIKKLIKHLGLIVPVVCVLYLQQIFTGVILLREDLSDYNPIVQDIGFTRYLATPDFIMPYILIMIHRSGFKVNPGSFNFLLLIVTQLSSLSRSAAIGTIACLIHFWARLFNSGKTIIVLFVLMVFTAVTLMAMPVIGDRMGEGFADFQAASEGVFEDSDGIYSGTFSYRLAHFSERNDYVYDSLGRWPFGLGFIHEESAQADYLGFRVGIFDPIYKKVVQVDTGDIAWSLILVKTGYLGMAFVIVFFILCYKQLNSFKTVPGYVAQSLVLYHLFTSFTSTALINPSLMMQLAIFVVFSLRAEKF